MTQYGFASLKVEVDNAVGGDLADLSAYVLALNGVEIERILEEITPAGVGWEVWYPVGLGRCGAIEISGAYEDTAATGPNAILNGPGETRSLQITWGSTKTTNCEVIIQKFARGVKKGELTTFTCTLQPTDIVSEA